jgi:hypothetical protein
MTTQTTATAKTVTVDHSEFYAAKNVITLAKLDTLFRLPIIKSRAVELVTDSQLTGQAIIEHILFQTRSASCDLDISKSLVRFWALGTPLEGNEVTVKYDALKIMELLTRCETPLESRSDYAFSMGDAEQLLKDITGF